jgi:CBS domain-containing protein
MNWTVGDVMSHPAVTVDPSVPFKRCLDVMRIHEVSAVPVVDSEGKLAGMLSEADLMRHLEHERPALPAVAADLMTRDVVTVDPAASIAAAARLMIDRHVKSLPVVDATGRVTGIVSRVDVLRVFLRSDESIRREISKGLLNELPLLGRGRAKVDVVDGVVHLQGEVESEALTGLLLRLVAAVPGVVGIENHLHLVAATDARPEPAGVRRG